LESSPLRSLSSAAVAVGVTGVLSISIPLALLTGLFGRVTPIAAAHSMPLPTVALRACDGTPLDAHPVLRTGDCVLMRAAGFTAAEPVQVREENRPGWARVVRAAAAGQLDFRMVVSKHARLGADLVSFVGLDSDLHAKVASCDFTVAAG
jgi:hypothetical protein